MHIPKLFSRRVTITIGSVLAVLVVAWVIAYEPVTRNLIARDHLCNYCHLPWEFDADVRLTATRPHPLHPTAGEKQVRCVQCHLPEGWWNTTYAYTHFLSITDLFGNFRNRAAERAGAWIPPYAAMAYRVRDDLFRSDSSTCRTCHIQSEIKPKTRRGINAHKLALEEKSTCIECHDNLVHRWVDNREDAYEKPKTDAE